MSTLSILLENQMFATSWVIFFTTILMPCFVLLVASTFRKWPKISIYLSFCPLRRSLLRRIRQYSIKKSILSSRKNGKTWQYNFCHITHLQVSEKINNYLKSMQLPRFELLVVMVRIRRPKPYHYTKE